VEAPAAWTAVPTDEKGLALGRFVCFADSVSPAARVMPASRSNSWSGQSAFHLPIARPPPPITSTVAPLPCPWSRTRLEQTDTGSTNVGGESSTCTSQVRRREWSVAHLGAEDARRELHVSWHDATTQRRTSSLRGC
jgi:hypothetical protein